MDLLLLRLFTLVTCLSDVTFDKIEEIEMWEHKQSKEEESSGSFGQHIERSHLLRMFQSVHSGHYCSVRQDCALRQSSASTFFNLKTAAFWKSTKNDPDSPHSPACWLSVQFTAFLCWPLTMISRTLVRSIILVSMSMMSGWSLAPLMNSSSVSSPETRSNNENGIHTFESQQQIMHEKMSLQFLFFIIIKRHCFMWWITISLH